MCGHHFQQTGHQPGMVANPTLLVVSTTGKKTEFPCPSNMTLSFPLTATSQSPYNCSRRRLWLRAAPTEVRLYERQEMVEA